MVGGGDGTSWSDTANWSTNALPGILDDVVINLAGSVTVNHGSGAGYTTHREAVAQTSPGSRVRERTLGYNVIDEKHTPKGFHRNELSMSQYIQNQEEHHRRASFQDEFRRLCKKYRVDLDERYVWD